VRWNARRKYLKHSAFRHASRRLVLCEEFNEAECEGKLKRIKIYGLGRSKQAGKQGGKKRFSKTRKCCKQLSFPRDSQQPKGNRW
jgi:hypothetical protein